MLKYLEIKHIGKHHSGLDDCKNISNILIRMLDDGYILEEGRDYLFISNADNLGATIDLKILNYIIDKDIPFLMEVTAKTSADTKGGALCQEKGQIKLLETTKWINIL